MKIGFDAKRAFFNRTGLGNYSRNLISALYQHAPEHYYQLFTPKLKPIHYFPNVPTGAHLEIINPNGKLPASIWRAMTVPKLFSKYGTQIYHGLSAELPFNITSSYVKSVVTIHDLIFLRFPELYPTIDRIIYKQKTLHACNNADHIIAISEQTKTDLIAFLGIEAQKISVVYQNCDFVFTQDIPSEKISVVKAKYKLPDEFILNVGTLEKRKNAAVIIAALSKMKSKIPLVLVGKPTDYLTDLHNLVKKYDLEQYVHFLHEVGYEELPALYRSATLFVYPSIFEGFGIPIIEALYAGLPVIAATGSCLEEAGGPSSLYFQPQDATQLAAHIALLLNDEKLRKQKSIEGLNYVQLFNARSFAEHTLSVYNQLLSVY